mgnify:CR=1 FL=1
MFKYKTIISSIIILYSFSCSSNKAPSSKESNDPQSIELFDGKTLSGWKTLNFGSEGDNVLVSGNKINLNRGEPFTANGIEDENYQPPTDEYEINIKARKTEGRDFFCAVTFPVPEKDSCCTFVAGAWGGQVTGLSNIDYLDANRNSTRSTLKYETDKWYNIKVEITYGRIRCWIDDRIVVNTLIDKKIISMRPGPIEACQPFGIASYETSAEFESITLKSVRIN